MTREGERLERPGGTIGYLRDGAGPAVLLLHATLSNARQLQPLAAYLRRHRLVLRVDRRGHGRSLDAAPDPPAPIDVAVHVDDLIALLDAASLDRADLVGHSYGGCVALELAARHPQRVRSVVAYEPPYLPVLTPDEQGDAAAIAIGTLRAAEHDGPGSAALAFMAGVSGEAAVSRLSDAARARVMRAGPGAVGDATLAGLDPANLERIAAPVLIVHGGRSEARYARIASRLAERIPGARVTCLASGDHLAPITRPDTVAPLVEDFLSA